MPIITHHPAKEETPEPPKTPIDDRKTYDVVCFFGDKCHTHAVKATEWEYSGPPGSPHSIYFYVGDDVVAAFNRDQLVGFTVRGA